MMIFVPIQDFTQVFIALQIFRDVCHVEVSDEIEADKISSERISDNLNSDTSSQEEKWLKTNNNSFLHEILIFLNMKQIVLLSILGLGECS